SVGLLPHGDGIGSWGHLTLFDPDPAPPIQRHRRRRRTRTRLPPRAIDVEGFHVTAEVGDQNIHFYYREGELGVWTREGQTPSGDIRALGANPIAMRQQADAVAQAMVEKLGGLLTEDLGNTWY
ncbi:MAG: hypothetical protein AAFX99_27030, partial [Myxococcota bacterium]